MPILGPAKPKEPPMPTAPPAPPGTYPMTPAQAFYRNGVEEDERKRRFREKWDVTGRPETFYFLSQERSAPPATRDCESCGASGNGDVCDYCGRRY